MDAARGRVLTTDDLQPGEGPAAVVSDAFWRDYGPDLGSVIRLSGVAYTVIGIAPPRLTSDAKVWIPVESLPPGQRPVAYAGFARLRDGASVEEGVSEIEQLAAAQVAADSGRFGGLGATARPAGAQMRGRNRPHLWTLVGVVGAVLLIGLSNLTSLFLVRADRRSADLAVRASLGGSRWQLGVGLAAEAGLIGAAGAALGLLLSHWGKDVALAVVGGDYSAPTEPVIGVHVVAVAMCLGLLVSIIVGLEPMRRVGRIQLAGALQRRSAGSIATRGERRVQNIAVAGQIAACMVLVIGSLVLTSAHERFQDVAVGYDERLVAQARPDYELADMSDDQQWDLALQVTGRLAERSDIAGATAWRVIGVDYPPRPEYEAVPDGPERALGSSDRPGWYYEVTPSFFETLGVPLIAGRSFVVSDAPGSAPVAIASRQAAEGMWPGEDPVGRQVKLGAEGEWLTVVGVVENIHHLDAVGATAAVRERPLPLLFRPVTQARPVPVGWRPFGCCDGVIIAARSATELPSDGIDLLRGELTASAPTVPLQRLGMLSDFKRDSYLGRSLSTTRNLLQAGTVAGLLLALAGLVGVVSESVTRRTSEIGVRIALGARRLQILQPVARQGAVTSLSGIAAGLAIVVLLHRTFTAALLNPVEQRLTAGILDPGALAAAAVVVVAATVVTTILTARRALGVDPIDALRSQ